MGQNERDGSRPGTALRARAATRGEHYLLETPLTPEECATRLQRSIRSRRDIALWGREAKDGRILIGWATPDQFSVRLRERWFRHNTTSTRPMATGRFIPRSTGTHVEARLGLDRSAVQIVRWVVGTIAVLFALIALVALVRTAIGHGYIWWVLAAGLIVVLWQVLGGWRGRRRALDERNRLLRALADIVEAHATNDA